MANLLYRLGRFSYQRRRLVAAVWAVLLVVLGVGAVTLGGQTTNTFSIPGTESQRALDALQKDIPAASGASANVVVKAPAGQTLTSPTMKAGRRAAVAAAKQLPEVAGVVDPFTSKAISPDGGTGLISVQFSKPADELSTRTRGCLRRARPGGSGWLAGGAGRHRRRRLRRRSARPRSSGSPSPRWCWS